MEISYNRLFKLLIDKGMKICMYQMSVSMDSLIKMCKTLNCTFDDIVEMVGEE
ncbi:helix-turn-helix domain-containing protein [Holdemanella biformis]|uniref:helix-turn-helix domain-containing protein n=1 Tax=Holdemanella biformis TaxID=1735 RepID=UPI0022E83FE4|nr:helix-turn-helix domain-containing protein [Holdemanella biformis]